MAIPTANRPKGRSVQQPADGLGLRGSLSRPHRDRGARAAGRCRRDLGRPYAFKLIIDKGFAHGARKHARHRPLVRVSAAPRRRDGGRHRGPLSPSFPGSASAPSPTSASRCTATCCACLPASSRRPARPRSRRASPSTPRLSSRWSAPPCRSRCATPILAIACVVILFALAPKLALPDPSRRAAGRRSRSRFSAAGSARSRPAARTASPTSARSPAKCWAR